MATSLAVRAALRAPRTIPTLSLARAFSSSTARAQAEPVDKPVLNKEFKIYRWVSAWAPYVLP